MSAAGFNIGSASTNVNVAAAASSSQSPTGAAATAGPTSATGGAGPATASSCRRDINQDVCNVPGFTVLQWLLSQHPHVPHVYFMMMALLVGQPVQQLPQHVQVARFNWLM